MNRFDKPWWIVRGYWNAKGIQKCLQLKMFTEIQFVNELENPHHFFFYLKHRKEFILTRAGLKDIVDCSLLWICTFGNASQYVTLVRHQPNYFPKGSQGCLKHLLVWHPWWVLKDRIADNVKNKMRLLIFIFIFHHVGSILPQHLVPVI